MLFLSLGEKGLWGFKTNEKNSSICENFVYITEGNDPVVFQGGSMRKATVLLSWLFLLLFVIAEQARAQWVQTGEPGRNLSYVRSLAVSGSNFFAGVDFGGGVFLSTNNGSSWTAVNNGLTNREVYALAAGNVYLYAGTYGGGVFRSSDAGTNWTAVNNGLTNSNVQILAVSGADLFAGTGGGGVFRSRDTGATWAAANNGLTNLNVYALAINGVNLFAGTYGGGVFRSIDTGANWAAVNTGLTNRYILSFAASDTTLFAGTEGGGVFRSMDRGTSWTAVNNGLTEQTIFSFAISKDTLFAGYGLSGMGTPTGGVFLSTNNGASWTNVSTGLSKQTVAALLVSNGYLFAGSYDSYVWRRPLSEMIPGSRAGNPDKMRNASGVRVDQRNVLRYTLAEAASVSIKVFDVRGRLMFSSITGKQPAGPYSLRLPPYRLCAGSYIVDFIADDFSIRQPFVIMRP